MALEKDIVLANGLTVDKAYIQLTTATITRDKEPVLDDDGKKIPVEAVPKRDPQAEDESDDDFKARRATERDERATAKAKGYQLTDVFKAKAHVAIYASKADSDSPEGAAVERRTMTFKVDPNLGLMAQVYDAMKSSDDFSGAKDV
jgi:hypothetical protein